MNHLTKDVSLAVILVSCYIRKWHYVITVLLCHREFGGYPHACNMRITAIFHFFIHCPTIIGHRFLLQIAIGKIIF